METSEWFPLTDDGKKQCEKRKECIDQLCPGIIILISIIVVAVIFVILVVLYFLYYKYAATRTYYRPTQSWML